MRCNNCGDLWTQMPDDAANNDVHDTDDALSDFDPSDIAMPNSSEQTGLDEGEEDPFTPALNSQHNKKAEVSIPKSIRPDQRDRGGRLVQKTAQNKNSWKTYALSAGAACLILGVGIGGALSTAETTILEHQNLRPLFAAFGKDPYGKVEDLTFDQVMLSYNIETESFDLMGALINLKKAPVILPMAKVVFSDKYKIPLDVWDIALVDIPVLQGESSAYFEFSYPMDEDTSKKVASITVEFAGGTKPLIAAITPHASLSPLEMAVKEAEHAAEAVAPMREHERKREHKQAHESEHMPALVSDESVPPAMTDEDMHATEEPHMALEHQTAPEPDHH